MLPQRIIHQSSGKRFIMGDFNQLRSDMEQVAQWEALGWKEVQVWRYEQTGTPIERTCRGTTTKDFIFVSPELLPWLREVEVIPDIYPDHAVIAAHFAPLGPPEKIALWKKPRPIDWQTCRIDVPEANAPRQPRADLNEECQDIAKTFETRLHQQRLSQQKPGLHPSQTGRSVTTEVVWKTAYTNPTKPSRSGDKQPPICRHFVAIQSMVPPIETPWALRSNRHIIFWRWHQSHPKRQSLESPGGFMKWWKNPSQDHWCTHQFDLDTSGQASSQCVDQFREGLQILWTDAH